MSTASLLITACGSNQQPDDNSNGAQSGAIDVVAADAMPEEAVTPLSTVDLLRVCKAGMSAATGAEIPTMKATPSASNMVRIAYVRDDGKAFAYDCRVEGRKIRTRMIDEAGPGTGPGIWSGRGSTATYDLEPNAVSVHTRFFDGSSDEERFSI